MEESHKVTEALNEVALFLRDLDERDIRANNAADVLDAIANLPGVADLSTPTDLLKQMGRSSDYKLSGVTFIPRPKWLNRRDLFTLSADSNEFGGWRIPGHDDRSLIAKLEQQLRSFGENIDESNSDLLGSVIESELKRLELAKTDILLGELPFLPNVTLIHLVLEHDDGSLAPDEALFFGERVGEGGWNIESFDYSSGKIHQLNQKYGIQTAGHELLYLRYFMHVVRGDEGSFRVIDGRLRTDIELFIDSLDSTEVSASELFGNWKPLACVGAGPEGGLMYEAHVLYYGLIFQTLIEVRSDGTVEMLEDSADMEPIEELREA